MTPTISSLLSRVRAASGPDRELDADICAYLYGGTRVSFSYNIRIREDPKGMLIETDNELGSPPHITASIDSAVALVERVLPGGGYRYTLTLVIDDDKATFYINCREAGPDIEPFFVSEERIGEASKPLAILAALLSALEQKESQ